MTHNFTPIYIPKKTESRDSDTCTRIFMPALFTVVKRWIQPKCPSTGECINKMWYIYKMEYYSAIKIEGSLDCKESQPVHPKGDQS